MKHLLLFFVLSFLFGSLSGQLQSPQEFLEGQYGLQFTPHHKLVAYAKHVSENSNRVMYYEYGKTEENRPLVLLYISNPENLNNIEDIRNTNLANAGFEVEEHKTSKKSIVWLSFGVHGNEAGASESSMNVMYNLADESNKITGSYLEKSLIILDPCINPDGYSRYTHWVRGISGANLHPGLNDIEHMEPWPSGRVNHYLFDLNRDWAWQTQVETQHRIKVYNQWMPHVHVDFHEMGYNDHYYFAPAAEPMHPQLSDFQRKFQETIGKNHSKYFDENGWLYFTREIFDLYYPSYGDTYPMFNGAIGMTYEKAGHGMAGRSIAMNNGDTLTLQNRIDQHTTTALSTIETASINAGLLFENFGNYFKQAKSNPKGKYKSYLLKNSGNLEKLVVRLELNGIKVQEPESGKQYKGFHYQSQNEMQCKVEEGDKLVSINQPKSILTQILLEPNAELSDSLTYDITAWALPYAYGVDCYGISSDVASVKTKLYNDEKLKFGDDSYAYGIPWENIESATLLSELLKKDIRVRVCSKELDFEGHQIQKGSLIVSKGDNHKNEDFGKIMSEKLDGCKDCFELKSGWSLTKGGDIGGSSFTLLYKPKVLLLMGEGTANNEVGQVWHYFDKVIKYPLSRVMIDNFDNIDLSNFNTLILPDGWYSFEENQMKKVSDWVSSGGKIIAVANAMNLFVEKEGYGLVKNPDESEMEAEKEAAKADKLSQRIQSYEDSERRNISRSMPGAIIENIVDDSHPLAYGIGNQYYSLKNSSRTFALQTDMWNVMYIPEEYKYAGFIGANVKAKLKKSITFGVEDKGAGKIIYMVDNPLFRGFWENGNLLFSNALFLVN